MNDIKTRPLHQRLLIASYILGSLATLLGALAAIGATVAQNSLQYPKVNGSSPASSPGAEGPGSGKTYFDL